MKSVRAAVPKLSWVALAPIAAVAVMMLTAWIDPAYLPLAGTLFGITLVVPPCTVRPSRADITGLGPDGVVTRLAAGSTKATAALWLALGTMTTYLVLSDVNPTTPGVIVAMLVAGGIVVASAARRLTSVSLLATNHVRQEYPRQVAYALAAIRCGIALGVVGIAVWEHTQPLAWVLSGFSAALILAAGILAVRAVLHQPRWKARNFASLDALAPEFAVHISGPEGSAYQLAMWLPFLDRAGLPYVVIVREAALYQEILGVTSAPVVYARTLGDLDQLVTLRFGTVLYVNNGVKNGHLVRRSGLHHIQLLHGESDKVSSRNPVAAMYDTLFVAGQAAVDRYLNHGISIPLDRFRIVGRPQVESIEVARTRGANEPPCVLYAPTWNGFFDDADYSSLTVGTDLIAALLDAGARVVFRPHPYSAQSAKLREPVRAIESMLAAHAAASGLDHVFGPRATVEASTNDCFNMSDAMVSDVSSVPIDYLFSEKPLAIIEMHPDSLDRTPGCDTLAIGAYVARPGDDLNELARSLTSHDTKGADRARTRVYYLGAFDRETYADAFITALREHVAANPRHVVEDDPDDKEARAEAESDA